jgi:hypothetical protein
LAKRFGCDLFLGVGGNHAAGEPQKTTTMKTTTLWKFTLRAIRAGLIDSETARNAVLAILANRSAARNH